MNKTPCFTPASSSPIARALGRLAPIVLAAMMLLALAPASALALDTAKCTARPNGSTGSEVYGGTETRVTWEGQADADEAITGLSIVFPQGTTFNDDTTGKARITLLTADQSQRLGFLDADYALDGETFTATQDEPAQAGGYLRVEIYGVFFPVSGGEMVLSGSYTLEDGATLPVDDIQPIAVTGVSTTGQITSWLSDQE